MWHGLLYLDNHRCPLLWWPDIYQAFNIMSSFRTKKPQDSWEHPGLNAPFPSLWMVLKLQTIHLPTNNTLIIMCNLLNCWKMSPTGKNLARSMFIQYYFHHMPQHETSAENRIKNMLIVFCNNIANHTHKKIVHINQNL